MHREKGIDNSNSEKKDNEGTLDKNSLKARKKGQVDKKDNREVGTTLFCNQS